MNYDNVKLIPRQLSTVSSRNDVDLSVPFGGTTLKMPILHSPMDTIGGLEMCKLFRNNGLIGCFPRENWSVMSSKTADFIQHSYCIVSVGLYETETNTEDLYELMGLHRCFLIDVANGFNSHVEEIITRLVTYPNTFIIVGNVASAEGYQYLASLGIDAVRVGIGTGSPCLTTPNTGIGQGMVSAVIECYEASLEMDDPPLIIADGGVKHVGDIAKAIAVGADLVMMGSMFAGTTETPGKIIIHEGEKYKLYHGSASYAVQAKSKDNPYYIEGMETLVRYKGTAQHVLDKIDGGLRSAFSYLGASNVEEFKRNCKKCVKFV